MYDFGQSKLKEVCRQLVGYINIVEALGKNHCRYGSDRKLETICYNITLILTLIKSHNNSHDSDNIIHITLILTLITIILTLIKSHKIL